MTELFILFLFFMVFRVILGWLGRGRQPSLLDILTSAGTTAGYRAPRRRRGAAETQADRLICPECGAANFPTEAVCWQCQRPLGQAPVARRVFGETNVQSASFQINRVTYNGERAIQFTDSRGRRHIFPSWEQAPKAVLDEIYRMPEPIRSQVIAQIRGQSPAPRLRPPVFPPAAAGGGPRPAVAPSAASAPAEKSGEATKPEQSQAEKTEQQKPPEEEAPWIEL